MPNSVVDGLTLSDGTADVRGARRAGDGWVMPGRDGSVCHVRDGFANCAPRSEIERRGAAPSLYFREGRFAVAGVVIDGTRSVRVEYRDGGSDTVRVEGNVFHHESDRAPLRVTWTSSRGPASTEFAWFVDRLEALQRAAPRNND